MKKYTDKVLGATAYALCYLKGPKRNKKITVKRTYLSCGWIAGDNNEFVVAPRTS